MSDENNLQPPQHQDKQPGLESEMTPRPRFSDARPKGVGRLEGKVALISGGDSGIGRAVAIAFAKEGASVAIVYLDEHADAVETRRLVEDEGADCIALTGTVSDPEFCKSVVQQVVETFGTLNVLVNNASVQYPAKKLTDISPEQLEKTFKTNVFGYFYLTQAALPHLKAGDTIVNTVSITAYHGSPRLMDYAATKGAELAFTRSLAANLVEDGIRVNAVAPGPIWTPLIPSSFSEDEVAKFGKDSPMGRPGQPEEVAPCYVFLASDDSSYMTGQTLHPNGGDPVNG